MQNFAQFIPLIECSLLEDFADKKCPQGILGEEQINSLYNILESYAEDCVDEEAWFTEGIRTGHLEKLLENDAFKSFIALTLGEEHSSLQELVGSLIEKKLDSGESAQA
jgi:hypothetical protein